MTRKHTAAWMVVVVVLVVALAAGWAWQRRTAAQAPPAAAAQPRPLELVAADVTRAAAVDLAETVPLSGTLRAVHSAMVRARVPGELQNLNVREGDAVRRGQVLAQVDPTDGRARMSQAREQAEAAGAQVEIARRQYDNNRALVDQGFISRTALDTSQSQLAAAQASHKAALAAVDLARKSLEDSVLRSPIDGVVSQRLAQPGERVGVDARILEIVDPRRLELEATLAAGDSLRVRVGQDATLMIEGAAGPHPGRVERINPSAQAGSRSVVAYLSVAPAPQLRQGLFAQGEVTTGRTRAIAVPLSAVRTEKPQPYLQWLQGDRVVHLALATGARAGSTGEALVAAPGLPEGAVVLRGHVGPLAEGTRVRLPAALAP
jgi:RND family efflux transporter MFP subunit